MVADMEITSRLEINSKKFEATKSKLEALLSKKDKKVLSGFIQSMTIGGLTPIRKSTILDSVLRMTRILDGKDWSSLDTDGINSLVAEVMTKYSKNGQESNTTEGTKKALQQWFRFLKTGYRLAKDCEIELGYKNPEETRRITIGKVDDSVTAEELVTREEKNKLMKACDNFRDKAIIDVIDDSGLRPHELLELQIKHVKSDKNGFTLRIKKTSKTGARQVRIIEATPTLANWLNEHPIGHDLEAPLFVNLGNTNNGKAYGYASANDMLKELCKKAKIRPLNFYLFRHTEVTRRASKLSDQDSKNRHGWGINSNVMSKYISLTGKSTDNSFLKSYGLEPVDEEIEELPKICPSCQRPNSHDTEICHCGKALTLEKAVMMEKEELQQVEALRKDYDKLASTIAEVMPFLKDLGVLKSAAEKQNSNELTTIPLKEFSKEVQEKFDKIES